MNHNYNLKEVVLKKFFALLVLCVVSIFGQKSLAEDTNVWLEITQGQNTGTNYIAVTVYYPTNFINWRLETSTDITGDYWRGLQSGETIGVDISPYGIVPRWKKFYLRPESTGPAFFRASGSTS